MSDEGVAAAALIDGIDVNFLRSVLVRADSFTETVIASCTWIRSSNIRSILVSVDA